MTNSRSWTRLWITLGVLAALIVTLVDFILLQRKHNIFTGGFLSSEHLETTLDISLFFIVSLIADLGLTLLLTGLALWIVSRAGLNAKPSVFVVLLAGMVPILMWTFFAYRIQIYLGQAFDYMLSYEVSGRNISEILAVVTPHLMLPVILVLIGAGVLIAAIWCFKHFLVEWKQLPPVPRVLIPLVVTGIVLVFSTLATSVAWVGSESLRNGLRPKISAGIFASIGESITDLDRDGFGLLHRPLDPAPLDSSIFPYALEIPGNNIDDNGVAGDLSSMDVVQLDLAMSAGTKWSFKPDVIFILLESFRADLMWASVNDIPVTPNLNKLVDERSGISTKAYSHAGFTAPSRYHVFSGNLGSIPVSGTLIHDFKANGYEVAYFSAQDVNFGGPGFSIGYEEVDVAYDAQVEPDRRFTTFATPGSIGLPYQVIVEKVTNFLRNRDSNRPLFLYINFQDTHFPYYHRFVRELVSSASLPRSEIGPARASELWETYANTAANVDFAVGQVIEAASQYLNSPNPGIIVTSDHGESLYDDGLLGHGIMLNDVQTEVPLIVSNLPIAIERPFGLSDLRSVVNDALMTYPEANLNPEVTDNPDRAVFQYLGNINRPKQIALKTLSGRTIYDFKSNRFKMSDGEWQNADDLTGADEEAFESLIHHWETELLATRAAREENS